MLVRNLGKVRGIKFGYDPLKHFMSTKDVSSSSSEEEKPEMSARDHWLTDTQTLARWLDFAVVKQKGRAHQNSLGEFGADLELLRPEESLEFPHLPVSDLDGTELTLPVKSNSGEPTLMCFAFRSYGTSLTKSWSAPFRELTSCRCVELYFIEYSFLSFAKNLYLSNLKNEHAKELHGDIVVHFGGLMDFAADLLLPNKFTGYAYLVDAQGKVRWRASGEAREEEIDTLIELTQKLRNE